MAKSTDNYISCMECKNAIYMQWFTNPIVAFCFERLDRQVAESQRLCAFFRPSGNKHPEITHFDSYEDGQTDELIHNAMCKRNLQ